MKAHERRLRLRTDGSLTRPQRQGPQWIWGQGALEASHEALQRLPGPYLLIGEAKLLNPLRKRLLGAYTEQGLELMPVTYAEGSECCEAGARAIAKLAKAKAAGTLIALGGGKCIDSVKWAGKINGLPVVTIPTSAATCACATAVVVAHDVGGRVLDLIDVEAPRLCIADFELLASAPARLLNAGLADTLAKWLEWKESELLEPSQPGVAAAQRAYELAWSSKVREELWEACLRLSAEASNWGMAPAAAAHSFCAGISLLARSREWLHGEWAGLGLLFQARILGQDEHPLRNWLEQQHLLTQLPFAVSDEELGDMALRILDPDESIHALGDISPARLKQALLSLRAA